MSRMIILRILLLISVAIMIGRLYELQIITGNQQRFGETPEATTRRYLTVAPRRGEIFAADGTTILAESVPIYSLVITPGRLPSRVSEPERRNLVLARVSQIAGITNTLTLSPTSMLDLRPEMRNDLSPFGELPALQANTPLTITVAPQLSLHALEVTRTYSDVLQFNSVIETQIMQQNVRRYENLVVKEAISPELALVVAENSNYLPGVQVIEGYQRHYPQSASIPSLSHTLGYIGRISECELVAENPATSWLTSMNNVIGHAGRCGLIRKEIDPSSIGLPPYQSDDRIGKDGIESAYENELRGQTGIETLLVDALERPASSTGTLRPVEHGHNLILTIDATFQAEVERIMQRWVAEGERRRQTVKEEYKRNYKPITNGIAVAIDPRDGRILAIVSIPSYDNNVWVDLSRSAELQALLTPADPGSAPLLDRAIAGQYPPGSTIKQFVGIAALQQGIISPETTLRDPGLIRLRERNGSIFILPNSVRNRDNGQINVLDALRVSSNVFFASIAGGNDQVINLKDEDFRTDGLGIDKLVEGLDWFNFGRTMGVDITGEAPGLLPTKTWKAQTLRESWTTGDTYNMAIGQGYLQVTPLQLAAAAGAIARDGTVYRPHVVQKITNSEGEILREIAPEVRSVAPVSAEYLAVIRDGMRRSVTEGLNIAARDECSGLSIAGKTGTAEFGPILTEEGRRQSHAWFVGFAPYEDPQIVVAVLIEGTGDLGDGASTMAVPAATQIMQAYFKVTPPAEPPRICPVMPGDPMPSEEEE
ncbi:peptidoglycan glycosyltransferase [Oscillochloris trichoides DG-6]|uniref:Peptidoglycan glycosyltransferase n=1 Tax=Oscillochloris trichoides DG-6 TaxID=765420 RepID=E1IA99_9CHLR|nr:penicillin-binding transpeptidase domain-containing protein [Oscillochloris trichoides]EFO81853.1 peptidoglycan glycosyltransferase [Oscillochloris trichoides DG-6]